MKPWVARYSSVVLVPGMLVCGGYLAKAANDSGVGWGLILALGIAFAAGGLLPFIPLVIRHTLDDHPWRAVCAYVAIGLGFGITLGGVIIMNWLPIPTSLSSMSPLP